MEETVKLWPALASARVLIVSIYDAATTLEEGEQKNKSTVLSHERSRRKHCGESLSQCDNPDSSEQVEPHAESDPPPACDPSTGRLRQEDCRDFQASGDNSMSGWIKTTKQFRKERIWEGEWATERQRAGTRTLAPARPATRPHLAQQPPHALTVELHGPQGSLPPRQSPRLLQNPLWTEAAEA